MGAHSLSEQLLAALEQCLRRRNPLEFLFSCKDMLKSSARLLNRSSGYPQWRGCPYVSVETQMVETWQAHGPPRISNAPHFLQLCESLHFSPFFF